MGLRRRVETRDIKRDEKRSEVLASAVVDLAKGFDVKWAKAAVASTRAKSKAPWQWYGNIGEIHYAVSRGSRIAGYIKLAPHKLLANGEIGPEIKSGLAADIVSRIESPYGGVRQLAARFYIHMKIPGDTWLIRVRGDDGEVEGYDFLCADEMDLAELRSMSTSVVEGGLNPDTIIRRVTAPGLGGGESITQNVRAGDVIGRVWKPSPQWIDLPDSPMHALETQCELLHLLTANLKGKLLSRMSLNGIFYIPNEINEVRSGQPDGTKEKVRDNTVMDSLINAATFAVRNFDTPEAAVPIFMTGPSAYAEGIRHIVMDREIYRTDMDLRSELIDRILYGLDVQPMDVKGMGDANHWCQDDQTEVWTRRGWQTVDSILIGDEVLALDHQTGLTEWSTVSDLYVADVVDEPMRHLESRTHSSLTTLAHRWPTVTRYGNRRWVTSASLNSNDYITTGAPSSSLPVVAKWNDALVEVAAWFWTEGNIGQSVSIAQSHTANPGKTARLRAALLAEFGEDGFTEAIQRNESSFGGPVTIFRLRKWAADALLVVAPGKRPTDSFIDSLTLAQLHLFIDVSCMGDGHHWKTGERDIWQRDPSSLDAYERACILAGYAVSRQPGHDGGTVVRALHSTSVRPVKAAQQSRGSGSDGAIDEIIPYSGRVWCPTVPGLHTYLARRNGRSFFTGNSAWAVSDDERRINIQPEMETMCWALTRMILRAEMEAAGATPGKINSTCIWYDLTAANVKTNLAEDARQAHDRALTSDSAARRMTGIAEADAPSEEEVIRAFGRKNNDAYLATFGLAAAKKIDWDKVATTKAPGPNADSPAPDAPVGPGVGKPGSPSDSKSDTPRKLRPA